MKLEEQIRAVPALVIAGNKQDITALFIRIRKVSDKEREKLLKIIAEKIYLHRAIPSQSKAGSILALFNVPERQYRHELEAVRTASEIQREVKELKSLDIGIAINTGKAIVSAVKNNTLRYTCLGDLVNLAKKLAEKSSNEIIISDNAFRKIEEHVKAKKSENLSEELGMPVYALSKISEREKYQSYIKQFTRRLHEEEKKKKK